MKMGIMQNMTLTQAYIIIGTIYGLILFVAAFVIWWYHKNNITVSISEWKEGVLFNTSIRCRFTKERDIKKWIFFGEVTHRPAKLYQLFDFFSNKPLDIEYAGLKDQIIATESMPFIGVKCTLKLRRDNDGGLFAWQPPGISTDDGLIKPNRMTKINIIREEIYESTKNETKADMFYKFALPMALIVLALAMLVFFPKIYNVIMDSSIQALDAATINWQDIFSDVKPVG